ncbi:MAG: hypothetical protein KGZ59_05605 [Chitinophagaceae bacterium]|nr:hypothetical protein [Chitinophagaceae bacterium]
MLLVACFFVLGFVFLLRVYKLQLKETRFNESIDSNIDSSSAKGYIYAKEYNAYQFIKKLKLRTVFTLFFVSMILMLNVSGHVSHWPNVKGLNLDNKQHSIAFRNLRGGNCINEFNALVPVVKEIGINNYFSEDIIGIFGKPDVMSDDKSRFTYNLFPNSSCKGVIDFYKGRVSNCMVTDCN